MIILQKLLSKLEIDRAVLFNLVTKGWQMVAVPVTALLIATRFTPEMQGYYFTFGSLLALQVFIELGLGTVIIQFAAHEWSGLSLDKTGHIVGDTKALSRLVSLAGIAVRWYLIGGMLLALFLGAGGYIFFSNSPTNISGWMAPWFTLCLLTGMSIWLLPVWSLLDGCNQVANVSFFRFLQGVCAYTAIWLAIFSGVGLWTPAIFTAVGLVCAIIFLRMRYWMFLKTLLFAPCYEAQINWRSDLWPMQWRIALSWVSGYFVFSLFVPVLFHYHGPVVAGQFGMTWSVISALPSVSNSWLAPKVPQFGILIARKEYKELDRIFWRVTKVITGITISIALSTWFLVYLINEWEYYWATRLLSPFPTGLLLFAQAALTISFPFSSYLRAHKREPLLFISVLAGILTGISTLFLGKHYSAIGVVTGYLLINLFSVPYVALLWYRCKMIWHADAMI